MSSFYNSNKLRIPFTHIYCFDFMSKLLGRSTNEIPQKKIKIRDFEGQSFGEKGGGRFRCTGRKGSFLKYQPKTDETKNEKNIKIIPSVHT